MFSFKRNGVSFVNYTLEQLEELVVIKKITEAEKITIVFECQVNQVKLERQSAYLAESDPLYMEWQFDKTDESEKAWRDKVAEIKLRYPLPTET